MQAELAQEPDAAQRRSIHIAGINAAGEERDNPLMCASRRIAWLQDTPAQGVWNTWRVGALRPDRPYVAWRDVVVLDAENRAIAVFNLTDHDLASPAQYEALADILRRAAAR
jgi:hypothetical protein